MKTKTKIVSKCLEGVFLLLIIAFYLDMKDVISLPLAELTEFIILVVVLFAGLLLEGFSSAETRREIPLEKLYPPHRRPSRAKELLPSGIVLIVCGGLGLPVSCVLVIGGIIRQLGDTSTSGGEALIFYVFLLVGAAVLFRLGFSALSERKELLSMIAEDNAYGEKMLLHLRRNVPKKKLLSKDFGKEEQGDDELYVKSVEWMEQELMREFPKAGESLAAYYADLYYAELFGTHSPLEDFHDTNERN